VISNKFEELMKRRKEKGLEKQEQKVSYELQPLKKEIIVLDESDLPFDAYTGDTKLDNFLHQKKLELKRLILTANLESGKILLEIQKELEKTSISFNQWLKDNDINKSTAFRQKRRYELFEMAPEENKKGVAALTEREVALFYQNREKWLELVKQGLDKKTIFNQLSSIKNEFLLQEPKEKVSLETLIFENSSFIFEKISGLEKLNGIEDNKKEKIAYHLEKLKTLLEG
jgi:hypothetical protein